MPKIMFTINKRLKSDEDREVLKQVMLDMSTEIFKLLIQSPRFQTWMRQPHLIAILQWGTKHAKICKDCITNTTTYVLSRWSEKYWFVGHILKDQIFNANFEHESSEAHLPDLDFCVVSYISHIRFRWRPLTIILYMVTVELVIGYSDSLCIRLS